MYAIRLELIPSRPLLGGPGTEAGAGPVRAALMRLPLDGARMCHARVLAGPDGLAAVCFLTAPSLLAAERSLRAGAGALAEPGGPLAGWTTVRCEADPWIALGMLQARARS
ncbi:hypothetical protein [Kitasatospora cheerisanensis]|uniref:Uncharacterized protein n=1 Tax=Kitasatospora cheerisanensis KCTC 2395 TaxID=1348663 RepID=A0A066YRP1_9ACTN|nr:hypothetical protein [Kitasatospora cheerisanensis]KDN83912.1 hypothetical protein KCH_45610 [Kitasatospora cheerisanensis KCTC 2395]